MHEYSETSQLQTRCTILESQIQVLNIKNAELQRQLNLLEKPLTQSFKDIPNIGKFPQFDI